MTRVTTLYRMFLRVRGVAPTAPVVVGMIIAASLLTAVAIARVSRQHEVLRLGYQLKQRSALVDRLREAQRQLQVESATLTSPERIKRLATSLGMTPIAPDRIRVIDATAPSAEGTAARLGNASKSGGFDSSDAAGTPSSPAEAVQSWIALHRNPRVALLP